MLSNKRAHVCQRQINPMNVGDAQEEQVGSKQLQVTNKNLSANQAVALEIIRVTKTYYGLGDPS